MTRERRSKEAKTTWGDYWNKDPVIEIEEEEKMTPRLQGAKLYPCLTPGTPPTTT